MFPSVNLDRFVSTCRLLSVGQTKTLIWLPTLIESPKYWCKIIFKWGKTLPVGMNSIEPPFVAETCHGSCPLLSLLKRISPRAICFWLLLHLPILLGPLLVSDGSNMAAKMAITQITTKSSISVNPTLFALAESKFILGSVASLNTKSSKCSCQHTPQSHPKALPGHQDGNEWNITDTETSKPPRWAINENSNPKSVLTAVLTQMALFDGIPDPRWYSGTRNKNWA